MKSSLGAWYSVCGMVGELEKTNCVFLGFGMPFPLPGGSYPLWDAELVSFSSSKDLFLISNSHQPLVPRSKDTTTTTAFAGDGKSVTAATSQQGALQGF